MSEHPTGRSIAAKLLERMKKSASGTMVAFDSLHVAEVIDAELARASSLAPADRESPLTISVRDLPESAVRVLRERGWELMVGTPIAAPVAGAPDLTNHHNALACPYCNPDGLVLAARDRVAPPSGAQNDEDSIRLTNFAQRGPYGTYYYVCCDPRLAIRNGKSCPNCLTSSPLQRSTEGEAPQGGSGQVSK